jgi:hypothetical protein
MHNVIITVVLSISVAGLVFFACRVEETAARRQYYVLSNVLQLIEVS